MVLTYISHMTSQTAPLSARAFIIIQYMVLFQRISQRQRYWIRHNTAHSEGFLIGMLARCMAKTIEDRLYAILLWSQLSEGADL